MIKDGNDFIEFDQTTANKVLSTKLPRDLIVQNDIVTSVQNNDIRGKDKKEIKRIIQQLKNDDPMFIEVLKSGFDPEWLDPKIKVRT